MTHALCPFEKAILSAQCNCELSTRTVVAERMNAGCRSPVASNNCRVLFELFKERSRFALRVTDRREPLPFGKIMKAMVGGLRGLQQLLHPGAGEARVENIHALVNEAQQRYGGLDAIPFQEIIKAVTAFRARAGKPPTGQPDD